MKCRLITWVEDLSFPNGRRIESVKEFNPFTPSWKCSIELERAMKYADLMTASDYQQSVTMEFMM